MTSDLFLRDVLQDDLPVFFEHQLDPDANYDDSPSPKISHLSNDRTPQMPDASGEFSFYTGSN
jgi:hypothetical protein